MQRDEDRRWDDPKVIWQEYRRGAEYKSRMGRRGMYEQNRINERFFVGDQWHGASCGSDRPLVRYNVIKRIGDYKMAVVGASPVTVNYSAEGVPNTLELQRQVTRMRERAASAAPQTLSDLLGKPAGDGVPTGEEVNLVMSAMSDYFRVTAERVQLDDKKTQVLRNAYLSGTGVLYTRWDPDVKTGLYADEGRETPVSGDIACEVLDIENVYFGNPNCEEVEDQPYILVAQRVPLEEAVREAKRNRRPAEEIENLAPDRETLYMAGALGSRGDELQDARNITVITKFYREWNEDGRAFTVKAVKTTEKATLKEAWDTQLSRYPFAVFRWEPRQESAYGESEITYLIPNQIAINRMITASVWAVMMMGMPIMVVDQDVVDTTVTPITNDPGQILLLNSGGTNVMDAVGFVNPPNFSPRFSENIEQMINQTLSQAGANDAALGDMRPENASAIVAVREAATMPLQTMQNRFYTFVEDVARIWADYWVRVYGKRALKVEDDAGVWYLPFDGARYRDMLISTRIDVGASTLWSEAQSIETLGNLFDRGVIDAVQYLTRLPKGTVPNVSGLVKDIQQAQAQQAALPQAAPKQQTGAESAALGAVSAEEVLSALPDEELQELSAMPADKRRQILADAGIA